MASADKFARLSALRPVRSHLPLAAPEAEKSLQDLPEQTLEECMLARMIGATVSRTRFGCHLSIRN